MIEPFDPFVNHPAERALFEPLVGNTMLELGRKKTNGIPWKRYFEGLDIIHTSVDIKGGYGSLKKDLTEPLNLGTFDMVTNIGTTEHVSSQIPCWRNIVEAMHIGSVLVSTTPAPGSWKDHGRWYPEEDFFVHLADLNGMEIERLSYETGRSERRKDDYLIFVRMRRVTISGPPFFQMPPTRFLYDNGRGR